LVEGVGVVEHFAHGAEQVGAAEHQSNQEPQDQPERKRNRARRHPSRLWRRRLLIHWQVAAPSSASQPQSKRRKQSAQRSDRRRDRKCASAAGSVKDALCAEVIRHRVS